MDVHPVVDRVMSELRAKREALGMPQYEAAARMGIPYRTFQRYEVGESEPRISEFIAWCRVLDMDVAALLQPEPVFNGNPAA